MGINDKTLQTENSSGLTEKTKMSQSVNKDSVLFSEAITMINDRITDLENKEKSKVEENIKKLKTKILIFTAT